VPLTVRLGTAACCLGQHESALPLPRATTWWTNMQKLIGYNSGGDDSIPIRQAITQIVTDLIIEHGYAAARNI
jgi:hypothetical protein